MNTSSDPRNFALALLKRSTCAVQVAAILSDNYGIYEWGWNGPGNGKGMHAEEHLFRRANPKRLKGSTLTVAAKRTKSGRILFARPCSGNKRNGKSCLDLARKKGVRFIQYTLKGGGWAIEELKYVRVR